jgi:hypothetical protein
MKKDEFERIAAEARANVKRLREKEDVRLLEVQKERLRQRLELEREANAQGVTLEPDAEIERLKQKIGQWPAA